MAKYMNICVVEKYEVDGEEKTTFREVGRAFPHESGKGYSCKIAPNLSVSGEFVLLTPKAKDSNNSNSQ